MTNFPELQIQEDGIFTVAELTDKEEQFIEKFVQSRGYKVLRKKICNQASNILSSIVAEKNDTTVNRLQGAFLELQALIEALDGFLPQEDEKSETLDRS